MIFSIKNLSSVFWDFPGGAVASNAGGPGSIPGQGTKIPDATTKT